MMCSSLLLVFPGQRTGGCFSGESSTHCDVIDPRSCDDFCVYSEIIRFIEVIIRTCLGREVTSFGG